MLLPLCAAAYTFEVGDYPGNDILNGWDNVQPSLDACADSCMRVPACKTFAWRPAEKANGWCHNCCWLKSGKTSDPNNNNPSLFYGVLTSPIGKSHHGMWPACTLNNNRTRMCTRGLDRFSCSLHSMMHVMLMRSLLVTTGYIYAFTHCTRTRIALKSLTPTLVVEPVDGRELQPAIARAAQLVTHSLIKQALAL